MDVEVAVGRRARNSLGRVVPIDLVQVLADDWLPVEVDLQMHLRWKRHAARGRGSRNAHGRAVEEEGVPGERSTVLPRGPPGLEASGARASSSTPVRWTILTIVSPQQATRWPVLAV